MQEYREKNNNLRNPDIRKHVYKQYTLAIHRRAGGSARRGWGRERVSRMADLFALSPFPRFMDLAGHAADLWPVRIHNRTRGSSAIVDGLCTNQVRGRVLISRFCALFEKFLDR